MSKAGYSLRYQVEYRQSNDQIVRVRIYKRNYTGSLKQIEYIKDHVTLKYKPSGNSRVIGSELSFSFITKDKAEFHDLLTHEAGSFYCEFHVNGVIKWSGWSVADNISTSYFGGEYIFSLSFTDRLALLDKSVITDTNGKPPAQERTLLYFIKEALKPTDLQLDFWIRCNTVPSNNPASGQIGTDLVGSAVAPFQDLKAKPERFTEVKDGLLTGINCKKVLDYILTPFNCYIFQSNNKFWIYNFQEIEFPQSGGSGWGRSWYYEYAYSNIASLKNFHVNLLHKDITDATFDRKNDLELLPPTGKSTTKFRQKVLPTIINPNSRFITNDLSWWAYYPAADATGSMTYDNGKMVLTSNKFGNLLRSYQSFTLNKISGTDHLAVVFGCESKSLGDTWPLFQYFPTVTLALVDSSTLEVVDSKTTNTFGIARDYRIDLNIPKSGNYYIHIITDKETNWGSSRCNVNFNYIRLFRATEAGAENEILAFDLAYASAIPDPLNLYSDEEVELFLGDSDESGNIAALKGKNNELTEVWQSHMHDDKLPLAQLYNNETLRRSYKYREKISLSLIDKDFNRNIEFFNPIKIDGKDYVFKSFTKKYDTIHTRYDFILEQIFNDDIAIESIPVAGLSTINGEQVTTERSIAETDPTVPQHVKNISETDINNWNSFAGADTIRTPNRLKIATPSNGVQGIAVGSIRVSDTHTSGTVPANGIYSKGQVRTDSYVYASSIRYIGRLEFRNETGSYIGTNMLNLNVSDTYVNGTVPINGIYSKGNIVTAGAITASGDITAFSDKRLKANIKPITNALEKIEKIQGVSYTRKDQKDKEKKHIGVIAQDLLEVVPEVVNVPEKANQMHSVDYSKLTALLIEGIKEQQKQIKKLTIEVNKMKGGKNGTT